MGRAGKHVFTLAYSTGTPIAKIRTKIGVQVKVAFIGTKPMYLYECRCRCNFSLNIDFSSLTINVTSDISILIPCQYVLYHQIIHKDFIGTYLSY